MNLRVYDPRIIAIDLRFRRSGYAVFEGPRRLLDYGTSVILRESSTKLENGFAELLRISNPQFIVLKKERWDLAEADPEATLLIESLKVEATNRVIKIFLIGHADVHSTFQKLFCKTKMEIDQAIARIFPELVWFLPPERKIWRSEHPRQTVFDAIALGLAYWQNEAYSLTERNDYPTAISIL